MIFLKFLFKSGTLKGQDGQGAPNSVSITNCYVKSAHTCRLQSGIKCEVCSLTCCHMCFLYIAFCVEGLGQCALVRGRGKCSLAIPDSSERYPCLLTFLVFSIFGTWRGISVITFGLPDFCGHKPFNRIQVYLGSQNPTH